MYTVLCTQQGQAHVPTCLSAATHIRLCTCRQTQPECVLCCPVPCSFYLVSADLAQWLHQRKDYVWNLTRHADYEGV